MKHKNKFKKSVIKNKPFHLRINKKEIFDDSSPLFKNLDKELDKLNKTIAFDAHLDKLLDKEFEINKESKQLLKVAVEKGVFNTDIKSTIKDLMILNYENARHCYASKAEASRLLMFRGKNINDMDVSELNNTLRILLNRL